MIVERVSVTKLLNLFYFTSLDNMFDKCTVFLIALCIEYCAMVIPIGIVYNSKEDVYLKPRRSSNQGRGRSKKGTPKSVESNASKPADDDDIEEHIDDEINTDAQTHKGCVINYYTLCLHE